MVRKTIELIVNSYKKLHRKPKQQSNQNNTTSTDLSHQVDKATNTSHHFPREIEPATSQNIVHSKHYQP